ncbi:MAG: type II toxin-antitoxin system HicB family antitoxin [Magnetococcales bacterium]|nr:type II toxin-antitoxin system HicB family antitoxin [Magnetococcales bacterium]
MRTPPCNTSSNWNREENRRWLADIPQSPGVMAYGRIEQEAIAKVEALTLRVLAERLENGEKLGEPFTNRGFSP